MKKLLVLFAILLCNHLTAQTTGSIKWKSAKGIEYNYTGELRDGKPHGVGYATTKDGMDLIFGYFKNGMQSGKAVSWSYGIKTIADYNEKDGYAYGPGAKCANSRDIIVGEFNHGEFTGKVISLVTHEIFVLSNGEDYRNGKIIKIGVFSNKIIDAYYVKGDLNGPGYYLDLEKNKLNYGTWRDNTLIANYSGKYPSFMGSGNLKAENNDDYIMVYSGISANNKIQDTCFYFDKKTNERNFGYFENGILRSGLLGIEDKIAIIGNWDEAGLRNGYCVLQDDAKELFIAGNYKKNKMDGDVSFYNNKEDIIYIGKTSEGDITGEGVLFKNNVIHSGNFKNGLLEGKGKIIYSDGRIITGEYSRGKLIKPIEITLPGVKKMNSKPKDLNTAINFLLKEWGNNFSNIKSEEQSGNEQDEYNCLYYFPGGISRILTGRKDLNGKPHHEFSSEIKKDPDYASVKKEYDNLCKQLSACSITSLGTGKPLKLISKINKLPEPGTFENAASFFSLPAYPGKKSDPLIRVMVQPLYDGYELTVDIISKWK